MSLLDQVKEEKKVEGGEAAAAAGTKKQSDYQKKAREARNAAAKVLRDWREGAGKDVKFTKDQQDAFELLTREPKAGAGNSVFGKPVIYQLFGNTPKVGSSITSLEVFQKTGKGFPEMKKCIKKWAEGGVEVIYDEKKTAYVIKSGTIPAFTE